MEFLEPTTWIKRGRQIGSGRSLGRIEAVLKEPYQRQKEFNKNSCFMPPLFVYVRHIYYPPYTRDHANKAAVTNNKAGKMSNPHY